MSKIDLNITSETRADLALLEALKKKHPGLSRAILKNWFKNKLILWNQKPLKASHFFTLGGFQIEYPENLIHKIEEAHALPSPRGCFLEIIYEDADLLVLNKISGTPTLPHSSQETDTAVSAALAHFPGLAHVGFGGYEPGLLHRLDTGTSGLLAFAKSQEEFERLRSLWKSGEVKKIYRAWVNSKNEDVDLKIPQTLKLKMGHDPKSTKKMLVLATQNEKIRGQIYSTETYLREIYTQIKNQIDLEVEIRTGVMHQIRCSLSHLGWPILGDTVYKGVPASRLMLHAWKLTIPTKAGKALELTAQLPKEWDYS